MVTEKEQCNVEWIQQKLKTLCTATQFCGLCLEKNSNFYPLKMEFAINECYSTRPLREVVNSVLNCDIEDQTTSDSICEICTEKTIQSYIFIENTKKSFKILEHCISDLLSKANDLSNELDENQDYKNANIMIVVEYDSETQKNVNELTTRNDTILSNKRIIKEVTPIFKIQKPTEEKRPLIMPILRINKYPRTETPKKTQVEFKMPAVTLEGGKIVITPLTTNNPIVPQYNTYKCNLCASIFTNYKKFKEHEKIMHNTKSYKCVFCNKLYNSQQYLDIHYTNIHSKSRCKLCQELFGDTELNIHLREKHESSVHICQICDLVYYSMDKLEAHCKSSHKFINIKTNKNVTQCDICLKNITNEEMRIHKCKFSCSECTAVPCIHFSYLMSYREQVLSNATKIRCLDCDYITKRKEHLITHANREHLDHHPFTCEHCGTQFYAKLGLKKHIFQFHFESKCQYCDKQLFDAKLLRNHKKLCKNVTRSYICEKCVASFDTNEELQKHQKLNHSDIVYPCTQCRKEFIKEEALKEHHIRVHNGIQYKHRRKFIECTLCDINFRSTEDLVKHEQFHGPNVLYPCNVCPKTFVSLKRVYVHKQRHYTERTKCPGCKRLFSMEYFNQHKVVCPILKEHQDLPYICKDCKKTFKSKSLLLAHQRNHEAKPCEICKRIIKPSSLKKHVEIMHSESNKTVCLLKCSYCDYTTKKKMFLENHINKVHHKIKPYVCNICGKSFCGKARLDEHLRTHTDNYVCYCSHCGKKFANKVCLKMHVRRHTGEKPYQCNICSERFRSMSIMKTHRLSKHLDKNIQCPLCDSMYHLAIQLRYHVKKVHWKRQEPFDYKQIVSPQFYHLFQDQRMQKLGEENLITQTLDV